MTQQHASHPGESSHHGSTSGQNVSSEFDGFVGAVHFAAGGADKPATEGQANHTGHPVGADDHTDVDTSLGHQLFADGLLTFDGTHDGPDHAAGDAHSIDQFTSHAGGADFTEIVGTEQGLILSSSYLTLDDSLNNDHLSGIFDRIDNLSGGFSHSAADVALNASPGFSFDAGDTFAPGLPDVFSDAKGGGGNNGGGGGTHGGGGGGGGGHGGSTPADYFTSTNTGLTIHISYDSSVGKAPSGFTSVVQEVADFFANSFGHATPITLNIAVGYGEVAGYHMGPGALGESVTNLQSVSYADLTNAYSGSGLSLGSSIPNGDLYVSYAEAKALDIAAPQTIDGYVGFSSQNGIFDYNNADGVSGNQYDFFGAVAHEISEVMGRILLVGGSINNTPSYLAYDFFHYSSNGVQDFSGNGGYFSTDLGGTILAYFNNASNGGDAGDWASSGTSPSPTGTVYDAFNAFGSPGEMTPISNTDLLALNAVGYDLMHPVTA